MKLLSIAIILCLGSALTSLHAQDARRNAIIVIRHAEDAAQGVGANEQPYAGVPATNPGEKPAAYPWPSAEWQTVAPDWPRHFFPYIFINEFGNPAALNENAVTPKAHALSGHWQTKSGVDGTKMDKNPEKKKPLGELQALALRDNLPTLLTENNLAEIKRAITMDPQVQDATPNPFDTLWPYLALKGKNAIDLYLVQRDPKTDRYAGMMALIKKDQILPPDGGSTIISWTGEGLDGNEGILAKITEKYRPGKNYWGNGFIARCEDIFVFYFDANNKGVAEKWVMDKDGKITLVEKHDK